MEYLRNRKEKCDQSIMRGRAYGIQVGEEKWERNRFINLQKKCSVRKCFVRSAFFVRKSSVLFCCIIFQVPVKFVEISKVVGYKTLKLRIWSRGMDLGFIGIERYLEEYVWMKLSRKCTQIGKDVALGHASINQRRRNSQ